jgi:hypothetical protein
MDAALAGLLRRSPRRTIPRTLGVATVHIILSTLVDTSWMVCFRVEAKAWLVQLDCDVGFLLHNCYSRHPSVMAMQEASSTMVLAQRLTLCRRQAIIPPEMLVI